MLYKGQWIGSLRFLGTGLENIKGVGTREVYVLKNLTGDRVFVAAHEKDRKISEEELTEIVNAEYPLNKPI